jgi:hypothetical protein
MAQFKSALAGYAGYLHYIGTLNSQPDQLSGAAFTNEPAVTSHSEAVLDDALSNQASQEIAVEVSPFIAQWQGELSAAPPSWVQRVQQSKQPLQLVKGEGHTP